MDNYLINHQIKSLEPLEDAAQYTEDTIEVRAGSTHRVADGDVGSQSCQGVDVNVMVTEEGGRGARGCAGCPAARRCWGGYNCKRNGSRLQTSRRHSAKNIGATGLIYSQDKDQDCLYNTEAAIRDKYTFKLQQCSAVQSGKR